MIRRVELDITDEVDPENGRIPPSEQVRIELVSGQTLDGPMVRFGSGHFERPLSDAQLHEKFIDCLRYGDCAIPAETLFGRLQALRATSARELTSIHCAAARR